MSTAAFDNRKHKVINCSEGCGRTIVVGKFSANTQACKICEAKKASANAPLAEGGGPKLTASVVSSEDMAREGVFGTPSNPRNAMEELQNALRGAGFQPAQRANEWALTVGLPNGGMARATAIVETGTVTAPDPHVARIVLTTQAVFSLHDDPRELGITVPPDVNSALIRLRSSVEVGGRPAQKARHIVVMKCLFCGADSAEYLKIDGKVCCLKCAGAK